jgi:Xaa-Pro aminopeptidase
VTADGCEVITKFPAEELLIAGPRYWAASGPLPATREPQSHLNTVTFAEPPIERTVQR